MGYQAASNSTTVNYAPLAFFADNIEQRWSSMCGLSNFFLKPNANVESIENVRGAKIYGVFLESSFVIATYLSALYAYVVSDFGLSF